MKCEYYETELSALVDGELDATSLLPTLDHLAACPGCREFYRAVRSLDAELTMTGLRRDTPPARLWDRIEAESGIRKRRVPAWAWKVAATVILGAGLWAIGALRLPVFGPLGDEVDIQVEANRGEMSEDDFIRLTTRLLESDRMYHLKMMEILSVVNARTFVDETPGGGPVFASARAESRDHVEGRAAGESAQRYW